MERFTDDRDEVVFRKKLFDTEVLPGRIEKKFLPYKVEICSFVTILVYFCTVDCITH